jgi:hypothetical protein
MNRTIIWEWVNKSGLEVLFLKEEPSLITASGLIAGELNGTAFKLRYKVECDTDWNFLNSDIFLESNSEKKKFSLKRETDGKWIVNEQERNDLEGCSYIDIMTSPFTNTLPIRNLKLKTNQPITIKVAYIKVPELEVSSVEQEYTRLDQSEPPSRFLYRNLSNDFKAEIEVDKDGIVIDYPNIWKRISLID